MLIVHRCGPCACVSIETSSPFSDSVENSVLRKVRERREAEKKAAEDALLASRNVTSTQTLLDKAAEEQKLREAEDRRIGVCDVLDRSYGLSVCA